MNISHQMKKNDKGGACNTNGGEKHLGFFWGNPRERNDLEELGMNRRIILNSNPSKSVSDVDCIDLAQDRERWNALVRAAMNLSVPIKCAKILGYLRN